MKFFRKQSFDHFECPARGKKFTRQTKWLSTKGGGTWSPNHTHSPWHRSTVRLWSWQSKSKCCHLGEKKKRENRKTKAAQSPMSCGRWEKRAKALSCKCNHVSLAVHYVCSSEQCDGARKTATPAWISFGNCERPSAARRPAITTEKARGKSKNRGKCTDTRIQIRIQKGVRTRN